MSGMQSHLSDPRYGFDLVVAVTQASVNATMAQLLAGLDAPEVVLCYVYDENDELVPIEHGKLVSDADGSDPFAVSPGARPGTDQDLINLSAVNFAGGVRARLGLPELPPENLPPIVTLGSGSTAPVSFNLMCSDFQVTGFQYGPRGRATWVDQSQPTGTGSPWYFSAAVELNRTGIELGSPALLPERLREQKLPAPVELRALSLHEEVGNAFTIQKLFLDLDTAVLDSVPTLVGVPPGWPVWNLITSIFLGSYLSQLRRDGAPVLNYDFTVHAPRPATLQLGEIARECLPLLDDGRPITAPTPDQLDATTLVYLGTTATTPPVPVPFPWNWVELNELHEISGLQAVRRDVFLTFLAGLLNRQVAQLCVDTDVTMTHSGEDFRITYSSRPSPNPKRYRPVAASPDGSLPTRGADGFTTVLTLSFAKNSHDYSITGSQLYEIWGDHNYALTGSVAVSGDQVRVQLRAQAYLSIGHRELFVNYTDLPGANYYDKTATVLWTLSVDQNGALQVDATQDLADHSAGWNYDPQGLLGKLGLEKDLKEAVTSVRDHVETAVDAMLGNYGRLISEEINGYGGWVFPGNDAFTFKKVGFSAGQDLIVQLTYADPS